MSFIPTFNDLSRIFTTASDGSIVAAVNVIDTVTVKQEIEMSAIQDYDLINMVAADTVAETWDVSMFDEMAVTINRDSGTTDTVEIATSTDGVTLSPVPVSGRDASDGAFISLTSLTSGQYTIPLNAKTVTFTKSGTTDPYTITWSARNSGRQAY